jgi:NADH:ubiquinone oxidoreductase subunit H
MEDVRKILVVNWMTQYCQKTFHYAVSLSAKYGAELSIIHVIDTLWLQGWNLPTMSQEEREGYEKSQCRIGLSYWQ